MENFCTGCGTQLEDQQRFCVSCGAMNPTLIEPEVAEPVVDPKIALPKTTESAPLVRTKPQTKLTVLQKVLLSLVLFIAAAVIVGHLTIKSMTSPEKAILSLYNAILDENETAFFGNIIIPKDVNYDAHSYMAYIREQKMDQFHEKLLENAEAVAKDGITRVVKHEDGSELFRLNEKKFLYFYPTVKVSAIGTDVKIETDLVNGRVHINGKDYELQRQDIELGSFLPGYYEVKAISNDPFFPNEATWTFNVKNLGETNALALRSSDHMIALDGDYPDSIVYVNGKSTEKTIEELKQIGPIFEDTDLKLTVQKETPTGETAVSFEEIVTGGHHLYFTYPGIYSFVVKTPEEIGEETFDRDKLKSFIIDFRNSYELALNRKKFSLVESYLAPGSVAHKELKDFVADTGDDYYQYDFSVNEVTGIKLIGEEANVSTYEEFYFTNHLYDVIFYERDKQYDIHVDDNGDYKIHKIHIFETKRKR
ncbi:hypothetical protein AB1K83_13190 [Sporosarcina sp. 179-K 3D1 HS]|uniref:TcaA NTF2-like domain-containing protein n=1 Tax=Sporosarcina sp. 179-K 3D1 HS TaxID=3232169 RepID=UPI00399F59F5